MGAAEPPYIYQPMPGTKRSVAYPYSDFNPRAATQAQYATLAERAERKRRRAAQNGKPLINFNQHPDSYMIVSQPNVIFEPLPPNTKKMVTMIRWVQFAFRCIEVVIAIGLLVCVICLKMDLNSIGWISRIAPAWDILVTMYAIYHLVRPARARTPATSASYHFFSLFMDTSLLPFYIFMALCANQNWIEAAGVDGRWTSFFSSTYATSDLILLAFVGSAVMAGLHLISVVLDFYLIVMFRRIARLPPDMNPLEDNLTSRRTRSTRHKHKNSEATLVSDSAEPMSEKKQHYLSGSTLSVDRLSRAPTANSPQARKVPFGHSRMNSDTSFSPHNPETARWSRQQFDDADLYDDAHSTPHTMADPHDNRYSRAGSSSPSKRGTLTEDHQSSRPGTYTNPESNAAPTPHQSARSSQNAHLLNDNWYVLPDPDLGASGFPSHQHSRHDSLAPEPLKMHPPTPPLASDADEDTSHAILVTRELTVSSHETQTSSLYSESSPSLTTTTTSSSRPKPRTPKGKYYGDLASATRGVRGQVSAGPQARGGGGIGGGAGGRGAGGMGYGLPPPTPEASRTPSPAKRETRAKGGERRDEGGQGRDARVVSRSGADIGDAVAGYNNNNYAPGQGPWAGMRGRREVSGKLAEEGRVAGWKR